MTKYQGARRRPSLPAIAVNLAGLVLACWLTIYSPTALASTGSDAAHHVNYAPAHTARTIHATDEAHLVYVRSSGERLFEEGAVRGTIPGSMKAYCSLGATFAASFTIYTKGGAIKGRGTATPHAGSGLYESFAGTLTVTGGTGRYAHAHGHAGLYGVFNRRTYALTVQTTGSLSY
jgi:hypothetical protein